MEIITHDLLLESFSIIFESLIKENGFYVKNEAVDGIKKLLFLVLSESAKKKDIFVPMIIMEETKYLHYLQPNKMYFQQLIKEHPIFSKDKFWKGVLLQKVQFSSCDSYDDISKNSIGIALLNESAALKYKQDIEGVFFNVAKEMRDYELDSKMICSLLSGYAKAYKVECTAFKRKLEETSSETEITINQSIK